MQKSPMPPEYFIKNAHPVDCHTSNLCFQVIVANPYIVSSLEQIETVLGLQPLI